MDVIDSLACQAPLQSPQDVTRAPGYLRGQQLGQVASDLRIRLSKRRIQRRLFGAYVPTVNGNSSNPRVAKRASVVKTSGGSKRLFSDLLVDKEADIGSDRGAETSKESVQSQKNCSRLSPFPWQSDKQSPDQLHIKPRHVEIKVPDYRIAGRDITPPSTPATTQSDLKQSPHQHSPRSTPRPSLPTFTFPVPPIHSVPPSPPWSDSDLVHGKPPAGSLTPRKPRIRILPDTPPSPPPTKASRVLAREATSQASQAFGKETMASNGITSPSSSANIASLAQQNASPSNNLSSLVCNVNRTTGERPPPLVGASSTIVGDKMYVFGGRKLSRSKPHLTNALYEIDLVTRHWKKLNTHGSRPIPRYFHSMNALGDTKLVCFGGMAAGSDIEDPSLARTDSGMVLLNDLHFYDIASRSWTHIPSADAPRGRYAHCAVILPSTSVLTSEPTSNVSAGGHSPAASQSGIAHGQGGAQLIVIGGQTPENKYVMEINVFNFRSKKWTRKDALEKEYGAYRSVAIPLNTMSPSQIGSTSPDQATPTASTDEDDQEGHCTLIYSNYNFLDVKLEFCLRHPDGTLSERSMRGAHSPPGLRFPNGDVHNHHFILSGTFLTSTRKEYALWALDLLSLTWSRIDVGPGILTSGSWNRGLLWRKRNTYVIFGDRRRKLDADYNHRRLNFANMMTVELEAYGLYDNPVTTLPSANFSSASSPHPPRPLRDPSPLVDRPLHSDVASTLGRSLLDYRELADLELLAIGGERIAVNSQIVARRWGPYLVHLLAGTHAPGQSQVNGIGHSDDTPAPPNGRPATIASQQSRNSSITITPGSVSAGSHASGGPHSFTHSMHGALNAVRSHPSGRLSPTPSATTTLTNNSTNPETLVDPSFNLPHVLPTTTRPRVLYLPHTAPTVRALVHYLYTWSLPPVGHPLCSAQILCSLLQIARPYRVDGLLESTVERLHQALDARNTAAVFNAAAMAAGGGEAVAVAGSLRFHRHGERQPPPGPQGADIPDGHPVSEDEDRPGSVSSSATSLSGLSEGSGHRERDSEDKWRGELSSVVGLQKRGLRGLMEGRRAREMGGPEGGEDRGGGGG